MSRNVLLVFSVICWVGVAAVALAHVVAGDFLVPAVMGAAFAIWVVVRQRHYARTDAEAVPVEA
ncbi:MAG TPA: hypothetical protein VFV72_08250 [Candidatus Limnocylindrales bacterium]|nr:hypothetical protein [Candidatus Limnocylindrales bacterium]